MSEPLLYRRRAKVTLGRAGEMGRAWEKLRFDFDVEKTPIRKPNTCTLKITNLNSDSRAFVEKGMKLILAAGYEQTSGNIFTGDVKRFEHRREGVDWITELEAGDGHKAITESYLNTTLAPGAKPEQILGKIKKAMKGADVSEGFTAAVSDIAQKTSGYTMDGNAGAELDQLLAGSGKQWSVQDGVLQIVESDGATDEPVVVLSPSSGLISVRKLEDGGLEVVGLIQHDIRPKRRVKVETEEISGVFVCQSVKHRGDTHGAAWFTTAILK